MTLKLSRRMSYILRHDPASAGLTLGQGGWVPLDAFVTALGATHDEVIAVVASDTKQRFSVEGAMIRANQGHSAEVDLGLGASVPPAVLYHGTSSLFLESIMTSGLEPRGRHAVHLSPSTEVARVVAARRAEPRILRVDASAMAEAGFEFTCSENGVWLTAHVPPEFLTEL